jgi:sulfite reductase (NADPH) hemoprotein beta-component
MYKYTEEDKQILRERVEQFRGQVQRRLDGELTEDEFRALRVMNGLYLQRHAYMLRVAIPYGLLSSEQLHQLGYIARRYDKGYGHFTTRQNIQFNWPKLAEVPDLLSDLADVEMHAIQTSGNDIRNITCDHFAGIAADEIEDPRPYCEILRQWSTFHPEFSYLPRKFKIAVTGATTDRAAVQYHDIGLRMVENDEGRVGFQIIVGGGMGRTPVVGQVINEFCEKEDLLTYCEAILRIYNLYGNRDNKYKARIKILVRTLGIEEMKERVDEEWERIKETGLKLTEEEINRVKAYFQGPDYNEKAGDAEEDLEALVSKNDRFRRWYERNVRDHREDGYRAVFLSLKSTEQPPGDVTADQMEAIADLAEEYSFARVRTTHDQNLVFPDVEAGQLFELWQKLDELDLATPNIGTLTDLICCPGLDYCSLANAGSISVAKEITERFDDYDYLYDLGDVELKMSGCINACGHHHVGHIGILGIDKRGEEYYQLMLGGNAFDNASLGKWLGPAIAKEDITDAVENVLDVYVDTREQGERFIDTYHRLGPKPFKERVYASS